MRRCVACCTAPTQHRPLKQLSLPGNPTLGRLPQFSMDNYIIVCIPQCGLLSNFHCVRRKGSFCRVLIACHSQDPCLPSCTMIANRAQTNLQIILASWNGGSPTPVFNNAAQVWNHTFFWEGMSPSGGGAPSGALAEAIDKAFGSFDEFKAQFAAAGATQFGSGWAWLVANKDGTVEIDKTPNAVCPMVDGVFPCPHPPGGSFDWPCLCRCCMPSCGPG